MERFLLTSDELRARTGGKWRMFPADVLPAFVAEMDFKVAPAIQAAIKRFTEQQDYGYGQFTDPGGLFEAFAAWMSRRHGWQPDPALTIATSDVVQGLVSTLLAFTDRGYGVIEKTPVYTQFIMRLKWTDRRQV